MISRRRFTALTSLSLLWLELGSGRPPRGARATALRAAFKQIEAAVRGRLGVNVVNMATGDRAGYRENERFPMCSTFKVLAAAAVLKQVDRGLVQLDDRRTVGAADLVENSPVTKSRVGGAGMTLAELCAAAIEFSDNTAGNMLLRQIGGPVGLNRFSRSLGDRVTRLDRFETELNQSLPGDPRDTTTPAAMLENLRRLVLGSALSATSRNQLTAWLKANKTGAARLRAGLPVTWIVGDKTGAGERGSTNDIAVMWPPHREPLLLAAYLTNTTAPAEERNAALADVGRAVAAITG